MNAAAAIITVRKMTCLASAPASGRQLVTVTIYDADGTVYGYGSDSVESYCARVKISGVEKDDEILLNMVDMMIRFIDASRAYFTK